MDVLINVFRIQFNQNNSEVQASSKNEGRKINRGQS
jgi:hypothetical protein